jgi:hypothetical protein
VGGAHLEEEGLARKQRSGQRAQDPTVHLSCDLRGGGRWKVGRGWLLLWRQKNSSATTGKAVLGRTQQGRNVVKGVFRGYHVLRALPVLARQWERLDRGNCEGSD